MNEGVKACPYLVWYYQTVSDCSTYFLTTVPVLQGGTLPGRLRWPYCRRGLSHCLAAKTMKVFPMTEVFTSVS